MAWFRGKSAPIEPEPINDLAPVIEDNTEYLPFGTHQLCPKCWSPELKRRFKKAGRVEARIRHASGDVWDLGYSVLAWREKKDRLEISCPCGFSWVELPADAGKD